ncbi:hypothetical protein G6011_07002 [Alternaria panax]|uniref:Uncharacterized protein n=1 Tax=Alternaria panax TaxID=48097 RepID=A0AAD4FA75_9PLEO|nr:hypothetical protein G6011_07002 [Alternaria panax]
MFAPRDITRTSNATMMTSEYLLPPLPDLDGPERLTMDNPIQDTNVLGPPELHQESERFEEIYKGYDAYHSQVRKLNWLKSHHAYTTCPEVFKHAEWLIETLHAIVARWEEVLPYIAHPYPFPAHSTSTIS